jgi:hypothetical protein
VIALIRLVIIFLSSFRAAHISKNFELSFGCL